MADISAMLDASPSAVIAVDLSAVIRYANDRVAALAGYRAEELLARPIWILVPEHLREPYGEALAGYAEDLTPRPIGSGLEYEMLHRDGSLIPVELSLTTMSEGDERWIVASVVDITTRVEAQKRARELTRAYLTLAQINQAIIRAPDTERLYAETCRVAVETGGFLGAWVGLRAWAGVEPVAVAGVAGEHLRGVAGGLDPDARSRTPASRALREGVATWSEDYLHDPSTAPWHDRARALGIRASASLPLRTDDGGVLGVLTLYSGAANFFDDTFRELMEQVAENVCYALSSFAARAEVERVAAQRRELLRRLVDAQEAERNRIAADLHDESVQALASADLRLGVLLEAAAATAPALIAGLAEAQAAVHAVGAGLRDLLFELEPDDASQPWEETVHQASRHILGQQPPSWSVHVDHDAVLPETERVQALRILKEALRNVRKHARAERVEVSVRARDGGAEVTVADDGVAFDLGEASRPGHRGLQSMRDRAEVSGGWCRVERGAGGRGTVVRFWIPGAEHA
jgi:PAS domain S-box-containing protein